MVQSRSPGALVLSAGYACILIIAMILWAGRQMPVMGVQFAPSGEQISVRTHGREIARLAPEARVRFANATTRVDQSAGELVPDFTPPGKGWTVTEWYAERDLLSAMARAGPVSLSLPGAAPIPLEPRPRGAADVSIDVWLLLLQATAISLLGVWLGVLRPKDWGARLFMISCLGVGLSAFSGALFDVREVTADGALLRTAQGANFVGSNICAWALLGVYLRQPRKLAPAWLPIGLVLAGIVMGLAVAVGLAPLQVFYVGLLVPTVGFVAVLLVQWFAGRGDPAARASIAWVGLTTLLGMSVLTAGMAAPQLLGTPSLAGDGMSFLPLFIVYGGIAFGVGGYRLFDLDRWTIRVLLGVVATFGLLALDAVLVGVVGLGGKSALAVAILMIGFLYLPLRGVIWRWVAGKPAMTDSELFQAAAEVAFSPSPEDRKQRWRALLIRLFHPLELAADPSPTEEATLRDGGVALALPAVAEEAALQLRYRDQGRRLFGGAQQALARELITLMRNAERTRDEYERGVRDERGRIARDLHDDVAARLLTSLHRQDVGEVRSDVRKAMAEIRTIVSSLTGRQISVEEALANLRMETAERLEAAGLALDWPVSLDADEGELAYRAYRHLSSALREVISNVLKHAQATRVAVRVSREVGRLIFSVHDNGRGLPPGKNDGGNGLRNIRSRLAEAGGEASMPATEEGIQVLMSVPVIGAELG